MAHSLRPLTAAQLYHPCPAGAFEFERSDQLPPLAPDQVVGQQRAQQAIHFATEMPYDGYNLFLAGSSGLGKSTLLRQILSQHAGQQGPPSDWCYLHNFHAVHQPVALELKAGAGQRLVRDMENLLDALREAVPATFSSDDYHNRMTALKQEFQQREQSLFTQLANDAASEQISLRRTSSGFSLVPMEGGKTLDEEQFNALSDEQRAEFKQRLEHFNQRLHQALHQLPGLQEELRARINDINEAFSLLTIEPRIQALMSSWADYPPLQSWLGDLRQDLISHIEAFERQATDNPSNGQQSRAFARYRVNLLVDNSQLSQAPLLEEPNPTYQNLLGRIEHRAESGMLITDFTLIKAGTLHRANGGYLVLDAVKLLLSPYAWPMLKRILHDGEIRIEPLERQLSLSSTLSLEPAPIPLRLKVALVGSRLLYWLLCSYDAEFSRLFKIYADFAEDLPRTDDNHRLCARLVGQIARQEQLLPLTGPAVARLLEAAARETDDAQRLSLNLSWLTDRLREASLLARRQQLATIPPEAISQALSERRARFSQMEERLQEQTERGVLLIETEGRAIAQINALTVLQLGEYSFGRPTRITATARPGTGGIVDIERETSLGGPVHSKGVLILTALLSTRYSHRRPLSLSGSIVFEQSYGHVEGDSASTAELCALLSAISGLPLRQDLALTGSINQQGQVQAIGGVNQKIEGFFKLCASRGLSGSQGVVIPQANVQHLMLSSEVRDAVSQGLFTIWPVATLDQALSLLTGMPAGEQDSRGGFPPDSVNGRIQQRLGRFGEKTRRRQPAGTRKGQQKRN